MRTPGLIDLMGEASRAESAAVARRMAAVGELFARRLVEWADTAQLMVDPMEATAAEVSAAMNISRARAKGLINESHLVHSRLPQVAALFARGEIDYRMVRVVLSRTANVDPGFIAQVDAALAERVAGWMRLSYPKLRDRLDLWVAEFDPAGVRVPREARENRFVDITEEGAGMARVYGHLTAGDGAALDNRLDAIAATVCDRDPRSEEQRRADALGALGRQEGTLACECGQQDCAVAGVHTAGTSTQVMIHLLGEAATLDRRADRPGYLSGFGVLPAESLRELAAGPNVTIKPVQLPKTQPQTGYRPSAGLIDFLQWRDLTCRWPGCDAPVEGCDIDHTTPWPFGFTHASGLKHFCRIHHLCKVRREALVFRMGVRDPDP
ncbi:HNH endonuclease signature motif containing protein [Mycolicibacterium sp.]|uniref:HNH endonuclease signature motif containing protein n=1 Tax=Mycolicibacterium sp. TaxID=2320850 RepID=UPI003D0C6B38